MPGHKKLNEYKNKKIVTLIKLSKLLEALIVFAIGVIQFVLLEKFISNKLTNFINENFIESFEVDAILKLFKDERIISLVFFFYTLFSLIFMYDAALFVFQKLPRINKIKKGKCFIIFLTWPYQAFYFFSKVNAIIKNAVSLGEFCWNESYLITNTSRFILHLLLKLFGFTVNFLCLDFLLKSSLPKDFTSSTSSTRPPLFNTTTTTLPFNITTTALPFNMTTTALPYNMTTTTWPFNTCIAVPS